MGRATGPAADRGATDVTPAAVNVRTRVHEYGGGSYALTPDGGLLYCDFGCQRLYYKREGAEPVCLVPADRYASGRYRFADFSVDASRGRVVCVREASKHVDIIPEVYKRFSDPFSELSGRNLYEHLVAFAPSKRARQNLVLDFDSRGLREGVSRSPCPPSPIGLRKAQTTINKSTPRQQTLKSAFPFYDGFLIVRRILS